MPWAIVSDVSGRAWCRLHGARVGDRRSRPLTTEAACGGASIGHCHPDRGAALMQTLTLVRWSVVAAVLLASGAAMLGVLSDPLSRAAQRIPSDELLAYDLSPPAPP